MGVQGRKEESSAKLESYIKIARPDHWIKNAFIMPGLFLALVLAENTIDKKILIIKLIKLKIWVIYTINLLSI